MNAWCLVGYAQSKFRRDSELPSVLDLHSSNNTAFTMGYTLAEHLSNLPKVKVARSPSHLRSISRQEEVEKLRTTTEPSRVPIRCSACHVVPRPVGLGREIVTASPALQLPPNSLGIVSIS